MPHDITIIIATRNRATELSSTLESLCAAATSTVSVNLVVVDNNSSDDTLSVVNSYAKRLSLVYLHEKRPGKNHAINCALSRVSLSPVVAFTDDDVIVPDDWFSQIVDACTRYPTFDIFGGPITNVLPATLPRWLQHMRTTPHVLPLYKDALLDLGDSPLPWPANRFPAGANLWFRRRVIDSCGLFDAFYGPSPHSRRMGSESSYLQRATRMGHAIMYWPHACVRHRVRNSELTIAYALNRMMRAGRTQPSLFGLSHKELFDNHPVLWYGRHIASLMKSFISLCLSCVLYSEDKAQCCRLSFCRSSSFFLESLQIAATQ